MGLNIIDKYNLDGKAESVQLLTKANKTFKHIKGQSYGIMLNAKQPLIFLVWKDNHFKVTEDNPFDFRKGTNLTPFQLLCDKFKGNVYHAISDIMYRFGDDSIPIIRVGVDYFKKIDRKDIDGITRKALVKWNKAELTTDYTKDHINEIAKYNGFVMRPDNVNFKQVVDGMYNIYQPFAHKPSLCSDIEKDCPWSYAMMKHVFQEHYELGLIYMQCLYLHPMQTLPILGLVSRENQTGKSTFANWLTMIFGANSSIIDVNSFGSDFTEAFAERNIVIIEEVKSKDEKIMAKLKALSTQKKLLVNKKNISMYDTDFFCKFVINSNHESSFVRLDEEDIRYWVRKIPKLPSDNANHNIEADLLKEIPKFLGYLSQLPPVDFSKSRMVFTEEEIYTDQLEKTKENSRSWLYHDIVQKAMDFFADNPSFDCLEFSVTDIIRSEKWYYKRANVDSKFMRKTLVEDMGLEPSEKRVRYRSLDQTESEMKDKTGFKYTIEKTHPMFKGAFTDMDAHAEPEQDPDEMPF